MPTTADNVRVAVTGSINKGPADTTLPEDALEALDGGFVELGYASEDGVTQAIAEDRTDIIAWQNADVVRKVRTSHDVTYAFSMLETNLDTLETYYGDGSVSGTLADGVVEIKGDMDTRGAWVIHVIDGDQLIRIVIPDGQVTERGDVEYVSGNAIMYPVTITAYPDDDDVKAYMYLAEAGGS